MAILICLGSRNISAFQQDPTLTNRVTWVASDDSVSSGESNAGNFILYQHDGGVACRKATTEESRLLSRRDRSDQLSRISPLEEYSLASQQKSLPIGLRATQHLHN